MTQNDELREPGEESLLTTHSQELRDFVTQVQQGARLENYEEAHQAARATLAVLGQSISGGEAQRLAAWVPPDLRDQLAGQSGQASAFDKPNFIEKISGMLYTVDPERVEKQIRAVLSTLRVAATDGELNDTISQLPPDLAELFH